ncbi:MAG: GxxExxY protein [Verrucomicrobiota bacterium]
MSDDLLYRDEVCRLVGASLAVHKDKGNGFAEPVSQDAMEIELELSGIPFDPQHNFQIQYRGVGVRSSTPTPPTCFASGR